MMILSNFLKYVQKEMKKETRMKKNKEQSQYCHEKSFSSPIFPGYDTLVLKHHTVPPSSP